MAVLDNSALISNRIASLVGDNVTFKVTPETLNAKASEISTLIYNLSKDFDSAKNRVDASAGYWQGEAATAYRNRYNTGTAEVALLLSTLRSYVTKLNTIAGNYTQTEQTLTEQLGTLPPDVII